MSLGQVVPRLTSDDPGLNFNPDFFIPLFKGLLGIISSILF